MTTMRALVVSGLLAVTCLVPACGAADRAAGGAHATTAITLADVRGALASVDAPSDLSSDYRVDVAAFAASIVRQLPVYVDSADPSAPPTTFRDPQVDTLRQMTASEASASVAGALRVYERISREQGASQADVAMISAGRGLDPRALSVGEGRSLALLQEGAMRLDLMFGQPDATRWSWQVTTITVVGTDTADVTYHLMVPRGQTFRFTRPVQTKRLHFGRGPDGAWVLDGWLDYPAFEAALRSSIEPSDEIPNLVPNWWDTLGAQ